MKTGTKTVKVVDMRCGAFELKGSIPLPFLEQFTKYHCKVWYDFDALLQFCAWLKRRGCVTRIGPNPSCPWLVRVWARVVIWLFVRIGE